MKQKPKPTKVMDPECALLQTMQNEILVRVCNSGEATVTVHVRKTGLLLICDKQDVNIFNGCTAVIRDRGYGPYPCFRRQGSEESYVSLTNLLGKEKVPHHFRNGNIFDVTSANHICGKSARSIAYTSPLKDPHMKSSSLVKQQDTLDVITARNRAKYQALTERMKPATSSFTPSPISVLSLVLCDRVYLGRPKTSDRPRLGEVYLLFDNENIRASYEKIMADNTIYLSVDCYYNTSSSGKQKNCPLVFKVLVCDNVGKKDGALMNKVMNIKQKPFFAINGNGCDFTYKNIVQGRSKKGFTPQWDTTWKMKETTSLNVGLDAVLPTEQVFPNRGEQLLDTVAQAILPTAVSTNASANTGSVYLTMLKGLPEATLDEMLKTDPAIRAFAFKAIQGLK